MTFIGDSPAAEPGTISYQRGLPTDVMITISDIRRIFRLGRSAAYELTHREDFPVPIPISARCYRWWFSEVEAYAESLRARPPRTRRQAAARSNPNSTPKRIAGTVRAAKTGAR